MSYALRLGALLSGMVALPVLAVALTTARVELPVGFEDVADKLAVSGFGGRNKGRFEFTGHTGEFSRNESRLGVFDPLYVSNSGKSTFTMTGESFENDVSASCEMTRKALTIGIVSFEPKKMIYQCDLRYRNVASVDRLLIGQPKAAGLKERLLAQDRRRGEALIQEQRFLIESIHRYQASKLQSAAPIGYWLKQDDNVVAVVELTDINPTFYVRQDLGSNLRNATLIAALALAVLRDPANSALED